MYVCVPVCVCVFNWRKWKLFFNEKSYLFSIDRSNHNYIEWLFEKLDYRRNKTLRSIPATPITEWIISSVYKTSILSLSKFWWAWSSGKNRFTILQTKSVWSCRRFVYRLQKRKQLDLDSVRHQKYTGKPSLPEAKYLLHFVYYVFCFSLVLLNSVSIMGIIFLLSF